MDESTDMPNGVSDAIQWQEYVNRIATFDAISRGATYQPVPDTTQGDNGLEGYTTDGYAFQAYHPDPDTKGKKLKDALCRKITNDLGKLERYKAFWSKTLSCGQIHTWTLVVPNYQDKKVLMHASMKANELRLQKLPFLTDDFQALVRKPKDFPLAMKNMTAEGLEHVRIPERVVADKECHAFQEESAEKITELDRKLQHISKINTQEVLQNARSLFLRKYLVYKNGLDWISSRYPDSYESIITRIAGMRSDIQLQSIVTPLMPPDLLEKTRKSLLDELNMSASFLPLDQRKNMSWGIVSEWLLECPLDFHHE